MATVEQHKPIRLSTLHSPTMYRLSYQRVYLNREYPRALGGDRVVLCNVTDMLVVADNVLR